MIQILYQNNVTGAVHEITTLCSAAKWTTKRTGSPAALELTVLVNDLISWSLGGVLLLKADGAGLFYGWVVKLTHSDDGLVKVTAYDQTWYLKKNKETYVFTGQRADQIVKQIADDFGLMTGELANTGYVIPSMVEDGQTLFDIALKALDYTLINTGRMFVLWDDFGALRITDVAASRLDLVLGDNSLATGYSCERSLDSETYNRIKLVQDNKATGGRDVYVFQDSNNMAYWGTLQNYEKMDQMNEAQIKERGSQMLELYNRPKHTFEVKALLDLSVRAGRALYIKIGKLRTSAWFVVDETSADLLAETMTVKLRVV